MKRRETNLILLFMFLTILAILAAIVVFNLIFQEIDDWIQLMYSLMGDLLSAIVIGLFLGLITKIITNKLFSVEINMKKMRDFGIQGIGTGKSTESDENKMFGTKRSKGKYPDELKLLFLTGNTFLKYYKDRIIKCLDNDCKVSLLIASPEPENVEYLNRTSFRLKGFISNYAEEVIYDSLVTVRNIKENTKNPDNFVVRFYLDEYQNNLRISRYFIGEKKEKTYYWLNVQPLSKIAIDLSIALKGEFEIDYSADNNHDDGNNICSASENGFDKLWDKYEGTEYIYEKALIKQDERIKK